MRNAISHGVHQGPWHIGVGQRKITVGSSYAICGLAEYFEVANDRILALFVAKKLLIVQTGYVSMNEVNRLEDMARIVSHSKGIGIAQTG